MSSIPNNPFAPLVFWHDTRVTVREDDEEKKMDAKVYHVRYMVGESSEKKFLDSGDKVESYNEKSLYLVPSVHKLRDDPFHYDGSRVHRLAGKTNLKETKQLTREEFCDDHDIVEVTFESPGVECCAMTKEEADEMEVPLQFLSGYLLGKSNGMIKIAMSKTELDNGNAYYENIRIIPEDVVKNINCLD
ncbi:hypothetical protein EU537_08020 [Candidatus Thorarchaeota archaeon]|nr:MAG: hypothetical protein EU537_08020 [Candidatus Thorarchaeota archaeon]